MTFSLNKNEREVWKKKEAGASLIFILNEF